MDFSFKLPTQLIFGARQLLKSAEYIGQLGTRVLLVTGQSAMDSVGVSGRLIDRIKQQGGNIKRYSVSKLGPTTEDIDAGVAACLQHNVDVVVALGGGSALDCGKAIAGVCSSGAAAVDVLYGRAKIRQGALPTVCIPTTAGTGSEMNRSAMIRDPRGPLKDGLRSDYLFPKYAVVDPELTWTVPSRVTAETGFDVLAHAVESYVSPKANPISDRLALEAIAIVARWLNIAIREPNHRIARERLSLASTLMGMNLANVGTCFPHRVDKSLCAMRPEISHGQSVALFYPYWLSSCRGVARERFAEIGQIFRANSENAPAIRHASELAQPSDCEQMLVQFIKDLGLSTELGQMGITEVDLAQLSQGVAGDLTVNPIAIQKEQLPKIFLQILKGEFHETDSNDD